MLRKLIVLPLLLSLAASQATFFSLRGRAAGSTEMTDLAAMLPDSDLIVTMDFDRALNVAAPALLNQDQVKIEHLKILMRTIENQIGLNPYEIRQFAAGVNIGQATNLESLFSNIEFTALVRTANPNANLLDDWVKRIDRIIDFKDEQTPTRKYMDEFRRFRDFKMTAATPEKIAGLDQKFQSSLNKTGEITAALDKLPKLTTDARAVQNLRDKNKSVADSIDAYLKILKADTERKSYRQTSINLLNRWNAVTLDDPQKTAKLAQILKESKDVYTAYKLKHDNAEKIERIIDALDPAADDASEENLNVKIDAELGEVLTRIARLPTPKAKKTAELNSIAESLGDASSILNGKLEELKPESETVENLDAPAPPKKSGESFYSLFNQGKREETINGKKMIVIDFKKLDMLEKGEKPDAAEKSMPETKSKNDFPNLAIAYLDEKTLIVGLEKTVAPFLKRDANYKNQKALDMLNSSQNSLLSFGISADAMRRFAAETQGDAKKNADSASSGSKLFDRFAKDISIYGSVNYDDKNAATNDISMSLGFIKQHVEDLKPAPAAESNGDSTFEIAGYQVGKDIFYDLYNSLRAMQATVSFKFDKNKVGNLARSAPRIIETIVAQNSRAKPSIKKSTAQPKRLEAVEDLLTAPQLYIELAKFLSGKS